MWADWAREELEAQRRADSSIEVWIDGVTFPPDVSLPLLDRA